MAYDAVDTRARGLRPRREQAVGVLAVLRGLDWVLLGATVALVGYGLWAIDGITRHDPGDALGRQAVYVAVGGVVFVATTLIDPAVYRRFSRLIFGTTFGLMVLVLVAGAATRGSRRWIDVGFFRFQPSEFGKVLFTLFLAAFLADRAKRLNELSVPLRAIAFAAVPILLVFVQPDIGTALVYTAVLAAVLFVSGVRWLHLAAIGAVTLLAVLAVLWWLPATGINVLKPYQAARLTGFTHPDSDPRGATYNVNQSITAVGAGGVRGRGDRRCDADTARLPARARDRLRVRLARRAARLLRCRDPAPALPARGLARPEDRRGGLRPLQRDRCGRARLRVRVPGVRERRHDDRGRADHRDPASVRVRRRLVDDREPGCAGDPPGDPRARAEAAPMSRGLSQGAEVPALPAPQRA